MLILCYHELADDEATPWILKPATFAEHLDILADRGYRFELLPKVASQNPESEKRVVITFDDGISGCIRSAHPLLFTRGIRAYFYICPGYTNGVVQPFRPAKYMTWPEIRELSRQHVIGAHSMTHPGRFLDLPPDRRRHEMAESQHVIEQALGRPCSDWATPHGDVDDALQAMAREVGFSTLVTTQFGVNRPINPFCLQRWEVHSPCPRDEFVNTLNTLESL